MTDSRGSDQPDDPLDALHAHNARVRAGRKRAAGQRRVVRAVAWVVLLAALALIGLGIALRVGAFDHSAASPPVTSRSIPVATTPLTTAPLTTAPAAPPTTTTAPTTSTQAAVPVTFVVHATRGDSWMEVRVGTGTGRVLYSGILRQGLSDRETGRVLWVRFGSVGNLDLTLNGKPVHTTSSGTVDAVVTHDGLHPS
jgi:hypothetical protein